MGYTIAQKIIKNHLVCGEMVVGKEIGLKNRSNAYPRRDGDDGIFAV